MKGEEILDHLEDTDNMNLNDDVSKPIEYPRLIDRFKAIIIDGFIIIILFFLSAWIFGIFENAPTFLRVGTFIILFGLYEPTMVSMGGTFGHRAMDLRVASNSSYDKNVIWPLAIIRFAIKWFLGWLSFLSILGSEHNRAIHDILSNSIVLYKE